MDISPRALKVATEFSPKLSFAERCAVLACIRRGVSTRVIAAAFKINRRTVTHIKQAFRGYRSVHDREKAVGTDAFIKEYLTEDVIKLINDTADSPELNQSYRQYDTMARVAQPSRRASGMAGVNYIRPHGSDFAHRIDIQWLDENTASDDSGVFEHPAGWYWRDLDSEKQYWNGDPENCSHMTSRAAFDHAKRELET